LAAGSGGLPPRRLREMAGGRGIDLKGTRALVTGGTSGLGLAMAGALARAGASMVLTSRSVERATAAAAGLPGAVGMGADVRDADAVARVVEQAWSPVGWDRHA